jgi:putative hydrolase of the HAD superfamily
MFEGFDEFFDEVFARFGEANSWRLFPETVDVLKALKDQGYELGIISNFDSRLFPVLRGLGIADFFDTITISSLAHAAKPSARIFEQALEKHAVDAEEALHVGDSERDDVKGAVAVGLTGVLLDRGTSREASSGTTIATLNELLPLLSRLQ